MGRKNTKELRVRLTEAEICVTRLLPRMKEFA